MAVGGERMNRPKRIRLWIATNNDAGRIVAAYQIDRLWAAHRKSRYERWTLMHRPTGYSAGMTATLKDAQRLARALMKKVPRKHWQFTDPETVRGNHRFKGCGALRDSYA